MTDVLRTHMAPVIGLEEDVALMASHAPLPVEVAELPAERLPDYMVLALYFVVAEALAGARKAHARQARVGMTASTRKLTVEVSDDGCEDAAAERGTRLSSLTDQLSAIDGCLDVESEPGRGTTVRVSIPRASV
jgi:signal transduction histidine kinase